MAYFPIVSKNLSRIGSCREGSCLGFLRTVSAQDTWFVLVTGVTVSVVFRFVFTGMELRVRLGLLYPNSYEKSDGSSPTARTDSVIMTGVIDAHERRHVAVADVENAFLQSDNDQRIIMTIRGKTAELLVRMNASLYRPYIWYTKKGVPMLYVKINKALYGMLRAALLFYRKLRADLEEMGFAVNPYDPCVANRDVNGSQCTIVWHVDDASLIAR